MTQSLTASIMILLTILLQDSVDRPTGHKKQIKTVLILGNSIVRHPPVSSIGWPNDWGMAASMADSDFVHRLIYSIHQDQPTTTIRYFNIAGWERSHNRYNITRLDSLRNPDLLIMRVAENVNDEQVVDSGFVANYDRLISYIDSNGRAVKVITDGFWVNQYVNSSLKKYAKRKRHLFIGLSDLSLDSTNMALAHYTDEEVGRHPSNKGMRLIADRIWTGIKPYFD